jgi:hypothetical protein
LKANNSTNSYKGTRRDPSEFEYSSTAPPVLPTQPLVFVAPRPQLQHYDVAPVRSYSTQWNNTHFGLTTTALAMERLDSGHKDEYDPGTIRERQYLNAQFAGDDDDISIFPVQAIEVQLGDPISDSEDELHL